MNCGSDMTLAFSQRVILTTLKNHELVNFNTDIFAHYPKRVSVSLRKGNLKRITRSKEGYKGHDSKFPLGKQEKYKTGKINGTVQKCGHTAVRSFS